jgi:hypothetical protein
MDAGEDCGGDEIWVRIRTGDAMLETQIFLVCLRNTNSDCPVIGTPVRFHGSEHLGQQAAIRICVGRKQARRLRHQFQQPADGVAQPG